MLQTAIKPIKSVVQRTNALGYIQCVQYHRKPRWMPKAKSKIFRVPERKIQDPDEKLELLRLNNQYKTQVRAVRSYLFKEIELKKATSTADHVIVTPEQAAAEMQRCVVLNNVWNANIADIRNQRLQKEMGEKREYILSRLELKKVRSEEALREAEELVRLEKERSKTFILKQNLDQAIEYALAHPVDYNFAINLQAEILNGRTSKDDQKDKSATASN